MGGGRLVVVGGDYDADEARRTAVHAADVFEERLAVDSLDDAVATSRVVIGTSPRQSPWNLPVVEIAEAFDEALGRGVKASDVALVFGPEERGLSNEELARCHRVAFVPTADEYSSLNLAQAVVVCLYQWLRSSRRSGGVAAIAEAGQAATSGPCAAATAATAEAQAAALDDLRQVLEEIDFLHGDQDERVMATVASMLTRSGLDEREVRILRGLARQIRWAARRAR